MTLNPWEQFQDNLAFARQMIAGGEAIERAKARGYVGDLVEAHPEDLYRAA